MRKEICYDISESKWRQVLGFVSKFEEFKIKVSDVREGREALWLLKSKLKGHFDDL